MSATHTLIIAAVCIFDDDGRLLTVRKKDTSMFMLPGGKAERGETMAQTAARELQEEVGIVVEPGDLMPLSRWRGAAANEPDTDIDVELFTAIATQRPVKAAEIGELVWIHPAEVGARTDIAPLLTEHVIPNIRR
ncbi:NUDIX domain-containing protein [Arthrobacter roseus]|uniref:NUDIX hydrolase n=1 Tax=Arthrobacter roseus TaxID=136274 RepID=UPI00308435A8|nr:8-oxo-dGTP pyrophosphatase MutT (NUDIX family) [Arthrobacter roseus]